MASPNDPASPSRELELDFQRLPSAPRRKYDSLKDFRRLPGHLQTRIVIMACWSPTPLSSPSPYGRPVVRLDTWTSRSLILVSRAFHIVIARVLYEHIRITRPSTLRMLLATISGRPPLGRLIKSLHIGPDNEPPIFAMPVRDKQLAITLAAPSDEDKKPAWCCAPPWHPIKLGETSIGPRESTTAIAAAIDSACRSLDVDLKRKGFGYGGQQLDYNLWHCRATEVHAATELYVMEMPRYEKPTKDSTWGVNENTRYPRLVVTTSGSEPPAVMNSDAPDHEAIFILNRSQILNRLATPKIKSDRFDDPLLFARSQIPHQTDPLEPASSNAPLFDDDGPEDPVDRFPLLNDLHSPLAEPALASTATIGGILSLTRALLAQTPFLQNLVLNGFLERAACGSRSLPELKSLQCLSVGQPPDDWSWVPDLRLDSPAFAGITRLRVCFHVLTPAQATAIINGLPGLRHLQWSYPREIGTDEASASCLIDTVKTFLACASPGQTSLSHHKRPKRDDQDALADNSTSILMEARLHPRDIERVLDAAPSPAARAAWQSGTFPAPKSRDLRDRQRNRLCLMVNRAYEDTDYNVWTQMRKMQELYDEARDWFEDGVQLAGVCGGGR